MFRFLADINLTCHGEISQARYLYRVEEKIINITCKNKYTD